MSLVELSSDDEFESFVKKSSSVAVVCFSATWCGPCKASKPDLEKMAAEYGSSSKNVPFGLVYEHSEVEAGQTYTIRAFPTYVVLDPAGKELGRIEGVNFDGLRELLDPLIVQPAGHKLGDGSTTPLTPAQMHAARLARYANMSATPTTATAITEDVEMKPASTPTTDSPDDVEMADASAATATVKTEGALKTLVEELGFSVELAVAGLKNGGNTLEGAVEWIAQHQDDKDSGTTEEQAKSYKCNTTGKLFKSMADLELHANRTGHTDFSESTEEIKPLTAEQKAAKILEIKALLKTKRDQRLEEERESDILREKERRFMGKEMSATREEMERDQRKHKVRQKKREKDAYRRERERIIAELAKDKAERMANKGKLTSKLSVNGYKPDAIQYDNTANDTPTTTDETDPASKKKQPAVAKIDDYIKKVSSYRAGGDGAKCLKILLAYIGNIVDNPDEPKFKSINTENKAYKLKVKPLIGAKTLLLAIGFQLEDTKMNLRPDADMDILQQTKEKLQVAYNTYSV